MNTYIERPIGIPINFPIVPADEIRSNYGSVCPFLSSKRLQYPILSKTLNGLRVICLAAH